MLVGPLVKAELIALLDDPAPLCVSARHQAPIYKLSSLVILTALQNFTLYEHYHPVHHLLPHELVHLLLNLFLPECSLELIVVDIGGTVIRDSKKFKEFFLQSKVFHQRIT